MLDLVQARLEDEVDAFAAVEDAASFAAIAGKPAKSPTAYVIPIGDQAQPNRVATLVSQELTERFGVVIATSNRRERHSGAAARDVDSLARSTRAALLGWTPDADHDPVEYASGRMLSVDQGFVWWLSEFVTRSTIRSS